MVDSSLATLKAKGNLDYVNELYNPKRFFDEVHHVSLFSEDSEIELEDKTIRIHVLKKVVKRPLWYPANVLFFLLQIIEITARNRISVIRGRSIGLSSFLGLVASKIAGVPLVVSLGGDNRLDRELTFRYEDGPNAIKALKKTFADLIEIIILRNADRVIVPNIYTKNYAASLKVDVAKMRVVGFTLKNDIFEGKVHKTGLDRFVRRFHLDARKPIVLFVGRLHVYKQVDVLLEAVPFVLETRSDAQFVFIGDGPLRAKMEERAKILGITQNVHFPGFQPTDVVKAFLSIASVVWIPMSGFVVFEAAAFAAPIVAFDIEWHHEFVLNGSTGLLVTNRDFKEMAQVVLEMLDNPEFARKCGENARHKLIEDYDPNVLKEREIAVYKSILCRV